MLNLKLELMDLNTEFQDRLQSLSDIFYDVINRGEQCGWTAAKHFEYLYIEHQYLSSGAPKLTLKAGQTVRKLFFDRLKMTMVELKREDMLEHEESVAARRYYQKQVRAIHALWQHQLSTLAVHIDEVVAESQHLQEQTFAKEDEQRKFDQVRVEMTRKLLEWNNIRFEESRKAAAQAADTAERQREWEAREAAREQKVRTVHKKKIKSFRAERVREREEIEAEAERVAALAAELAEEQYEVNVVRTEFRKGLEREKQIELQNQVQKRLEEEEARELRLEELRATVAITAERDVTRTYGETESSKAAAAAGAQLREWREYEELTSNHRSFVNHGFSATQIGGDKRLKVEAAIRAAGLAGSDYARTALQKVQPPTAPRADMQSTVFKFNTEGQ